MESSTWTEITINGKTYHSVDDMPPDVRAQYEQMEAMFADKNNNGTPDIAEDGTSRPTIVQQVTTRSFQADRSDLRVPRGSPSLRTYRSNPSGSGNGEVQMSRSTLVALLAGAAVVAGFVVWILSR